MTSVQVGNVEISIGVSIGLAIVGDSFPLLKSFIVPRLLCFAIEACIGIRVVFLINYIPRSVINNRLNEPEVNY